MRIYETECGCEVFSEESLSNPKSFSKVELYPLSPAIPPVKPGEPKDPSIVIDGSLPPLPLGGGECFIGYTDTLYPRHFVPDSLYPTLCTRDSLYPDRLYPRQFVPMREKDR